MMNPIFGTQQNSASQVRSNNHHRNGVGKPRMMHLPTAQADLFDLDQTPVQPFQGTTNPRHIRALRDLLRLPVDREDLDQVVGCRNSPELVAELRRRGLKVPCLRTTAVDKDGRLTRVGTYYLTELDRMLVKQWSQRTGIEV